MNLLPVVPSFNSNLSSERYLGYHSFENVNCKYSSYDKLSEFSRLSNSSYQINNTDKSQNIRNSRYYEGDLMQVVIEPKKVNASSRVLNDSTKDYREFNSSGLLNATQNNVKSKTNPLRKRNCNILPDDLNIKNVCPSKISKECNKISEKESHGTSEVVQHNIKAAIIDDDDLADYFIGIKSKCNKTYPKPVCFESRMPTKLFEVDMNIEGNGLSSKYSVFEYGHKSVDVEKLLDPNFNKIDEGSKRSNLSMVRDEKCNKLTSGDSVVNNSGSAVPVTAIELKKSNEGAQKLEDRRWKLIPIDCPLRVGIRNTDVNLKNCSTRDPRLSHLRS